ncbi:synaptotagmin-2 isoform 1-T1 [Tautogolabrus adspersus]
MVMQMDYPAPVRLPSTAGDLTMPFSDMFKYCILGISVTLLLLALVILAWQTFKCCTQRHSTYTQQDTLNNDLQSLEEKPGTSGNYSGAPSTRVGDVNKEVYRLSRCLSQTSLSASESIQREEDVGEQVKIKKGQGLTPVMWSVLQEWHTRIVKGSCNPLFGDQFSCVLQEEKELNNINLRMEVRDFDRFSRHTVLGEVRVPLGDLNISYPLELQEDLQIPQKDLVGEVLLSLKFLPTSQRLEVGLLKVRTVLPEKCSDTALYARISVQCNHCKLRYQKTSAMAHCLVTIFNEVLMFSLPEFPLEQCKILVSVYETRLTRKSPKHLIGQLTVEKERRLEDEHWSLMMASVRQPIAKWHGLLI